MNELGKPSAAAVGEPTAGDRTDDGEIFAPLDLRTLILRSTFGGTLMGLANLVPGISGGTMLLAAGIYPRFIEALAELTRFRFRFRSLVLLGCILAAAAVGILLLAGTLKTLVVDHRWVMYSLFIGLTLGGLPVVWRLARPASGSLIISALLSFAAMVGLAWLQRMDVVGGGDSNLVMLFLAGLAGAGAMILPGVSGGYLLLLLGQYVPILSAIDSFKEALRIGDLAAATGPAFSVLVPVGLGVVAGVIVVGNLLQWLLHHFQKATLGVLIGLLIGSTVGLWPFQQGTRPLVGDTVKAQVMTEQTLPELDPEDWPTKYFVPTAAQQAGSLLLIGAGFLLTVGIARIGATESSGAQHGD